MTRLYLRFALAVLSGLVALSPLARAQTGPGALFETVVAFNGANGASPLAGLTLAKDGTLYGTTAAGGRSGKGTVFRLTANGVFTTLVSFDGTNGDKPWAPLVEGLDGNFYGTTFGEYPDTFGSIFRLTPAGALTNLHTFTPNSGSGSHCSNPQSGLVQTPDGVLYGTTVGGAVEATHGSIYTITPSGRFSVVLDFTGTAPFAGSGCSAPLLLASDGNFYGTTGRGGAGDVGTIFRFKTAADFTTLVNFGDYPTNGGRTFSTVCEASDGNFYGNTLFGAFYRLTRSGVFTIIHDFARQSLESVIQASDGCLYGATVSSVFRYNPATGAIDDFTNTCGYEPWGPLVETKDGLFYGTLYAGNCVFRLTFPPFISVDPPILIPVGVPVTYQIKANRLPTGYSAAGLPPGLTVDPATGLVSGLPTQPGTFAVALTATNAAGATTSPLTLTVEAAVTPVIDSPDTATGQVRQPFSYQITARNRPVSFAVTGLPASLDFDAATGLISGTPTTSGTFAVLLAATNSAGTGTTPLTLTVALAPPLVTLTAPASPLTFGGSERLGFTLTLDRPVSTDLHVNYLVRGTAVNGTDYAFLKGSAKIKAGKTTKLIKVTPLGNGGGEKKTVKIFLGPGADYAIGTGVSVKAKILPSGQ